MPAPMAAANATAILKDIHLSVSLRPFGVVKFRQNPPNAGFATHF
jgi:hypothetical protein